MPDQEEQQQVMDALRRGNQDFFNQAQQEFKNLFESARAKNEVRFACSLRPQDLQVPDPSWSPAADQLNALDSYMKLAQDSQLTFFAARALLGFYSQISHAPAFFEIPQNLMRVAAGHAPAQWPFDPAKLDEPITGLMAGQAKALGMNRLAEVIEEAFDVEVGGFYRLGDYMLWKDGVHMGARSGGRSQILSWSRFQGILERGVNFHFIMHNLVNDSITSYDPPKTLTGKLADDEPEMNWTISFDPERGAFSVLREDWNQSKH